MKTNRYDRTGRKKWKLDRGNIVELVPGPKPYLWIGADDGPFYDCLDTKQVRSLRDELTKALRAARRADQ